MGNLGGLALRKWAQTLLLTSCLLVITSQLVPPAYAQSADAQAAQNRNQPGPVTLTGNEHSREGYFQLQVEGLADDQSFVIEQSSSASFESVDAEFPPLGSFRQISLSGFDNGDYYFRARVENGENQGTYSNTHQLSVNHYPLWQALGLFGLGALLFVTLVITLLSLHWRHKHTQPTGSNGDADG